MKYEMCGNKIISHRNLALSGGGEGVASIWSYTTAFDI